MIAEKEKRAKRRAELIQEDVECFLAVPQEQLDQFVDEIIAAKNVFVAGWGRAGLCGKMLAMNLVQIGLSAYVVGDLAINTPAIHKGDLLVINSGSGETKTMKVIAERAKDNGARLALVSSRVKSSIGDLADCHVLISEPDEAYSRPDSAWWPFYHVSLLVMDITRDYIMEKLGIRSETIDYYHNNLE